MLWRRILASPLRFPAAQRAAAGFAFVFLIEAMAGSLVEKIQDQIIDAERLRHVKSCLRKPGGGSGGETGDVLRPVFAGAQEEWAHDHATGPAADAVAVRGCDRRLGQLHVGGLDDLIPLGESCGKKAGDFLEHLIAFDPG